MRLRRSSQPQEPRPCTHLGRRLPPRFNLYSISSGQFLGEHMGDPLLAVAWDRNPKHRDNDSPTTILHSTTSAQSAPLATILDEHWNQERWIVKLSPDPESPDSCTEVVVEKIKDKKDLTFAFTMATDESNTPQTFVWRLSSNTPALFALAGSHNGWELSRASSTGGSNDVLAVCAEPGIGYMRKRWKTIFLGPGLTGFLGQRWETMVVITSLGLHDWNWKRLSAMNRGSSAGGAAAAAGAGGGGGGSGGC